MRGSGQNLLYNKKESKKIKEERRKQGEKYKEEARLKEQREREKPRLRSELKEIKDKEESVKLSQAELDNIISFRKQGIRDFLSYTIKKLQPCLQEHLEKASQNLYQKEWNQLEKLEQNKVIDKASQSLLKEEMKLQSKKEAVLKEASQLELSL